MNSKIPLIVTVICLCLVSVFCVMLITGVVPVGTQQNPEITPQVITATPVATPTPTVDPNQGGITGDPTATPTPGGTGTTPTNPPVSTPTPTAAPMGSIRTDIKAIYVGTMVGQESFLNRIIEWCRNTELNAVVIDIKEVDGYVYYNSNIPVIKNNGFFLSLYDAKYVINKLHAEGIYVIGRISVFKDGNGSKLNNYKLAVVKDNGDVYKEAAGNIMCSWFNPFEKESWTYNIDIALEAVDLGFDEIQFDYVRFPTVSANYGEYSRANGDAMRAITGFVEMAHQKITVERGVPIAMDVFGGIYEVAAGTEDQLWLGQNPLMFGKYVNAVCPMIYPSHYANDSTGTMGNGVGSVINGNKFTKPDLYPYEVIKAAMASIKYFNNQMVAAGDTVPAYRPYLQAFTAKYLNSGYYMEYSTEQIRAQIKAVNEAGYDSWILWDTTYSYKSDYFLSN